MSDGELDITVSYCKFVDFFHQLHVDLPASKQRLGVIIHSAKYNFEKCLHYLLIPDNASADLVLRTLTENLIILKFLLSNVGSYTRKWDMWIYNSLPRNVLQGETKKRYDAFIRQRRKEYNAVQGNKPEFEQLLDNKYGWAFPALKSSVSLKRIAESCDASDLFGTFGKLSFKVHANTSIQNFVSRMEDETYRIVSFAIDLMGEYIIVLMDCLRDKNAAAAFVTEYDELRAKIAAYFKDLAPKLKSLLD